MDMAKAVTDKLNKLTVGDSAVNLNKMIDMMDRPMWRLITASCCTYGVGEHDNEFKLWSTG